MNQQEARLENGCESHDQEPHNLGVMLGFVSQATDGVEGSPYQVIIFDFQQEHFTSISL